MLSIGLISTQWITLIDFPATYPLDSDLSGEYSAIQCLNKQVLYLTCVSRATNCNLYSFRISFLALISSNAISIANGIPAPHQALFPVMGAIEPIYKGLFPEVAVELDASKQTMHCTKQIKRARCLRADAIFLLKVSWPQRAKVKL